jgi:hypothetical protein
MVCMARITAAVYRNIAPAWCVQYLLNKGGV